MSDHVAFGESLDDYSDPAMGGVAGGRQPTGPDGHWLEPLTTIAHITAVTSTIRFGTNMLLAAIRRPVVLAKMATTIDVFSDGRLDLSVGVGWQEAEYSAAGLDFESIHQMPKPIRPGGVPIWVSGTVNRASMRRFAEYGRGWIPWGADAADPVAGIAKMREAVASHDRDPSDIEVVGALPSKLGADGELERLWRGGATDFRTRMRVDPVDPHSEERMAEIVADFRRTTASFG